MRYENKSNGQRTVILDEFGGLDRTSALCGGDGSFELRNLRRMADGTLARRGGLCPVVTLEEEIRAAVSILRSGVRECYAVAGQNVYYLAPAEEGAYSPEVIGVLPEGESDIRFACYDGVLLMLTGGELWSLTPEALSVCEGYVPLYGRDWVSNNSDTHIQYEPFNLLSPRVRIRYVMGTDSTTVPLRAFTPASVDKQVVNGTVRNLPLSYNASTKMINMGNKVTAGSVVEIYLTMAQGATGNRQAVTAAGQLAVVGHAEAARVMFYGGEDGTRIYMSRMADESDRAMLKSVLPGMCMLYVTAEDTFAIGDGIHAVTGACRHYDRSLIFTAKGTWMVKEGQYEPEVFSVNTALGCSVPDGVAVVGNDPITIYGNRILRWNSETDHRDECNGAPISGPIEPLLDGELGKQGAIYADTQTGDVWLWQPGVAGRIWIYQSERKSWTSYDGFVPRCVCSLGEETGVAIGKTLYALRQSATADTLVDAATGLPERHSIEAEFISNFVDFGRPEHLKRVCTATVVASCGEGEVSLTLENVHGRQDVRLLCGSGRPLSVLQTRGSIGRFRFLRLGVRCEHDGPFVLHALRLSGRGR